MKTPTKNRNQNKKLVTVISIVILLAALSVGAVAYSIYQSNKNTPSSKKPQDVNKVNLNTPTEAQTSDGAATKNNNVSPEKTPTDNKNSTNQTSTTISITAKNQNSNILQIRAQINAVNNSGSCTLSLSDGKQTIIRTAAVQALASISTCQGFDVDIPSSGLQKGTWEIQLQYTAGTITASTSDSVIIK